MSGFNPRAVQSQAQKQEPEATIAPDRDWRIIEGVGKIAMTVDLADDGNVKRAHVTYCPVTGVRKQHRAPLDAVYALLDAGDLDAPGCAWIVQELDGDKPVDSFVTASGVQYVTAAHAAAQTAAAVKAALKAEKDAAKAEK